MSTLLLMARFVEVANPEGAIYGKGASDKYIRTSYTAHADGRSTQNYRTRAYVLNGSLLTKQHVNI